MNTELRLYVVIAGMLFTWFLTWAALQMHPECWECKKRFLFWRAGAAQIIHGPGEPAVLRWCRQCAIVRALTDD